MKNTITRRQFIGAIAASASAAALAPDVALAESLQAGQKWGTGATAPAPLSAMGRIRKMIGQWNSDGKVFSSDKLLPDAEAQWDRLIQSFFDLKTDRFKPINAANLCPSLKVVSNAVRSVQELFEYDVSFQMRTELADATLVHGLGAIKTWIGLAPSNCKPEGLIALVRNTTEANNLINKGLVESGFVDPKKHNFVIWDMNHPTCYQSLEYFKAVQKWHNGSIRVVKTSMFSDQTRNGAIPSDPKSANDIVSAFDSQIDASTRAVMMSWQSNECGLVVPLAEIVDCVRRKEKKYGTKIHIHADGAQAFGLLDMRLATLGVDSLSGSFHKWACGPKQVGILYVNCDTGAASRINPSIWGYDMYINTPDSYGYLPEKGQLNPDAKRFSYLGQQNDANLVATWITALFHSGYFHPNVSPSVIEQRAAYLGDKAISELCANLPRIHPDFSEKNAYMHILTPIKGRGFRRSVILFRLPQGINGGDVTRNVYERHGMAIANLKVQGFELARITPTFYNSSNDVVTAVEAIIDVVLAMRKGQLANGTTSRYYA